MDSFRRAVRDTEESQWKSSELLVDVNFPNNNSKLMNKHYSSIHYATVVWSLLWCW